MVVEERAGEVEWDGCNAEHPDVLANRTSRPLLLPWFIIPVSRPGSHLVFLIARLYTKGRVLGHKRAKRNSSPNTSLLQIEGVATKEDAQHYLGKVRRESVLDWRDFG